MYFENIYMYLHVYIYIYIIYIMNKYIYYTTPNQKKLGQYGKRK